MVAALDYLGLEARDLDRSRRFYADVVGLAPRDRGGEGEARAGDSAGDAEADPGSDTTDDPGSDPTDDPGSDPATDPDRVARFAVGRDELRLRPPGSTPRGGRHVHYAMACPPAAYADWRERLADRDPEEASFGSFSSLYVDDPDGHCVEVGGIDRGGPTTRGAGPPVTGIFEVVLEVRDLAAAEARYAALGFEVVDRGSERRRVRLRGPFDLELWEPQRGIAGARGGAGVDLGLLSDDPAAVADAVAGADGLAERTAIPGGLRLLEADGHRLTVRRPR